MSESEILAPILIVVAAIIMVVTILIMVGFLGRIKKTLLG